MKAIIKDDLILGFWNQPHDPPIGAGQTVVDLGDIAVTVEMHRTHRYDAASNKIIPGGATLTETAYEKMRASDLSTWAAIESNDPLLSQIEALESMTTARRIREAALGIDGGWLKSLDTQIMILRRGLK